MRVLLRVADILERIAQVFGRIGAWLILPLIAVIMFDVITRKLPAVQFYIASHPVLRDWMSPTKLQELEWHLHTALFLLALGFAYTMNAHVRVDLVRERFAARRQAWIELFGLCVFLFPYLFVMIWLSWDFMVRAYVSNEASPSMTGLPQRWIIKSFVPLGLSLVACAGLATFLRHVVFLFGPAHRREEVKMNTLSTAESQHLPKIDDLPEFDDDPAAVAEAVVPPRT